MSKRCPKCREERIPVDYYCCDCGTELENTWKYSCMRCEHKSDSITKFCTKCGSPLFIANSQEALSDDVVMEAAKLLDDQDVPVDNRLYWDGEKIIGLEEQEQ